MAENDVLLTKVKQDQKMSSEEGVAGPSDRVHYDIPPDLPESDDLDIDIPVLRSRTQADVISHLPSKQIYASLEYADTLSRSKSLKRRSAVRRRSTRRSYASRDYLEAGSLLGTDFTDSIVYEEDNYRRLQQVKALTSSLVNKRRAREQLRVQPARKATGYEKWKLERKKDVKLMKLKAREVSLMFSVWSGSIKTIEAHFGSAVVAYFLFVKWLFLINLFVSVVVLAVIVLPQAILRPATFNESINGNLSGLDGELFIEQAKNCSIRYDGYISNLTSDRAAGVQIVDFFLGTGWMEDTPLFVGYYFSKTYVLDDVEQSYNMPLAVMLATIAYLLVTLIAMVRYTASGLKSRVTSSGDRFYHSCNTVFCGWDSSLTNEKAAAFKHKGLYAEYRNDLAEKRQAERRKNMTTGAKGRVYFIRVGMWLITGVILGAAGYLIYRVAAVWMPELLLQQQVKSNGILQLLVEFLPSITITVLSALIPPIFSKMVEFEDYAPETEISINIIRTVILRVASLAVLLITLATQILNCNRDCGNCTSISMCWESYVGQQIYKLVILDFIVVVAMILFVEFPRRLIVKKFPNVKLLQLVGLQEFNIPYNVIDIVYTQTICWIGGFFSPLVPVITVMKLFVFFYFKKLSLLKNCIPAARVFRASRASHFFMVVLMVAFIMCAAAIAYTMGSTEEFYMFTSLTDAIVTLPNVLRDILGILGHWAVFVALLVILFLVIYYFRAVAAGNRYLTRLLEEQLALEGKDRQFLLMRVNEVLNLT